jgi:hypothetical protein
MNTSKPYSRKTSYRETDNRERYALLRLTPEPKPEPKPDCRPFCGRNHRRIALILEAVIIWLAVCAATWFILTH